MSKNSIEAYDLPSRVASYDADMETMHPLNNLERTEVDQPVTLLQDLQILRDAGLADVSVFWLEYRKVVYGGRIHPC